MWGCSKEVFADYPEQSCQGCDKTGLVHTSQRSSDPMWMAKCKPTDILPLLLVHKVKLSQIPMYLYKMHNRWSYHHRTRQAESGLIKLAGKSKLDLSKNSLSVQPTSIWNQKMSNFRIIQVEGQILAQVKCFLKLVLTSHDLQMDVVLPPPSHYKVEVCASKI